MERVKQWLYYVLIGALSFLSLVFLPMIGSTVKVGWVLPTTTIGWIIWVVVKLIVASMSVLIFHCFMLQAKLNVREDEKYKQANDILQRCSHREIKPRSPRKWNAEQYGRKGTTLFVSSILSTIALTQAILTYDYMAMLVYLFVIIMSVILGVIQMKKAEVYWTTEYYDYAIYIQKEQQLAEEEAERNKEISENNDIGKEKE